MVNLRPEAISATEKAPLNFGEEQS
jgi:hypothetical protein